MYRNRKTYWSCTKFSDLIRGTNKLTSGTWQEWEDWHTKASQGHKIRYWIAENLLDYIQDFLCFPFDVKYTMHCYLSNRFVGKLHYLQTGLKPGRYYDFDYRLECALFNEMIRFVEIEKAWMQRISDEEDKPKFFSRRWKRFKPSRELGVKYLEWEASLTHDDNSIGDDKKLVGTPTPQAKSAQEILEVYRWLKDVRPNRPEPEDVSGWTEYCKEKENKFGSIFSNESETESDRVETRKMLKKLAKIEKQYNDEDEKMLIRIIKFRKELWT